MVWSIFWTFLVYDSPKQHPRIAHYELDRLTMALACEVDETKKLPVPWKRIAPSLPFIGLIIGKSHLNEICSMVLNLASQLT